jgi:toxin ParE1/3/4
MRLVFADPAERDLDSIIDYIALDDPTAAEKVYRAIVATARRLTNFPEVGRPGRLPGTRFQCPRFPI